MKQLSFAGLVLGLSLAFLGTSCNKEDDPVETPPLAPHEHEVITTITLQFTDSAGVQPSFNATFRDPDGTGGMGPDIHDTIRMAANTTYFMEVLLLNETETPVDTVSYEILEEDNEHLFCYTPTGVGTTIVRTDSDGFFEVGLQTTWYSGAAATGTVDVELKHQPGTKNGMCDPGETDIQVLFVTEVQ